MRGAPASDTGDACFFCRGQASPDTSNWGSIAATITKHLSFDGLLFGEAARRGGTGVEEETILFTIYLAIYTRDSPGSVPPLSYESLVATKFLIPLLTTAPLLHIQTVVVDFERRPARACQTDLQ